MPVIQLLWRRCTSSRHYWPKFAQTYLGRFYWSWCWLHWTEVSKSQIFGSIWNSNLCSHRASKFKLFHQGIFLCTTFPSSDFFFFSFFKLESLEIWNRVGEDHEFSVCQGTLKQLLMRSPLNYLLLRRIANLTDDLLIEVLKVAFFQKVWFVFNLQI